MTNSGKEEITNRAVEAVRATQGKSTEIIPISLTRKVTYTPIRASQVKKSSVANITAIKNVTINQTQQLKCQRRTPAHRQQNLLWMYFQNPRKGKMNNVKVV
jgi:hypothetical protein